MGPATGSELTVNGVQTRAELARQLSLLRARSGLTVRELASRLGVPQATLGGYFSGRHLPGPGNLGLFRSLLEACGVAADDLGPWTEALARARVASDGRVALPACPYRGLEPYGAEDATLFCGREAATAEVIARLEALDRDGRGQSRLLVVVGPSGSGKSSLMRAGVVPAVLAGAMDGPGRAWSVEVTTPGTAPPEALERSLDGQGPEGGDREGGARTPRLIVVDQLEEVFRVGRAERSAFLARLAGFDRDSGLVVAVLRADFFEAATMEPVLLPCLRNNQVLVGPMTEEEVREAIVRPAQQLGVAVEDGLVELLLADLAPRSPTGFAHDPGALPLMSHALLSTWERAQRNQLTVAAYRAAGGLRGAVGQSAEELWQSLRPEEQDMARRIFCRLVNVEEDAPFTRRRTALRELEQLGEGAGAVLARFVTARLLTADAAGVQVSHEALLSAWPRLAEWLNADRTGLRLHHELSATADRWALADRDPSLLLRGTRLAITSEWAQVPGHTEELTSDEVEFLQASEARETAEKRDARRRARRVKQLLGLVAALALAASALAGVALHASNTATTIGHQALSRQVAIEAGQLQATDPALAMQLALTAYRISPTVQARSALLDASASEMPTRVLGPPGPTSAAVDAGGHLLAVAESATDKVELYALGKAHPRHLATVLVARPPNDQTYTVALSPDGRLMAAAGTSSKVALFALSPSGRSRLLATLGGFKSTVYDVAFGPGGHSLAAASNDGTVRQWRLSAGGRPSLAEVVHAPRSSSLQAVAYSPDGRLLAAAGADGTLLLWDAAGGRPLPVSGTGTAEITSLAFSPSGSLLATGGQDDVVRVFSVGGHGPARLAHAPLGGFTSYVDSVAFSPDGRDIVAGGSDNSVREWSTSTWAGLAVLYDTDPVTAADFLPSGRALVTADSGGTVRLWPMPPPSTYTTQGPVFTIDYTANGRMLAAVSGGPSGDVALWDVAGPWRPTQIGEVGTPPGFGPVAGVEALSPSGRLLAVGNAAARIQLVSLANVHRPRFVGSPLVGAVPTLEQLVFSPQGTILASGDNAGRVHLWGVKSPGHPRALSTLVAGGYIMGVAFSPNGKLLAAASTEDKVWLWDISRPAHPRRLAVLGGFASYAYCVAFTPNGRTLIAGSADDTVRMWDVSRPTDPRPFPKPLTGPTSYVYSLTVSPDGRTLAASTVAHAVWLWDITDPAHPTVLADLGAATGQVFDATFSPDGQTLVASGSDQVLTFWDYRASSVASRICSLTASPITRAEWAEYVQGTAYSPPCP